MFKELDFATSLVDGPYAGTNLAEAFRRANAAGSADRVVFVDFKQYFPSYEAPAGFVASPIYRGNQKLGVLMFQFPIDTLNTIMKNRAGMGETGETYLVGSDLMMRSDSYLDPDHHSVTASFSHPGKGKVDTAATRAALEGKTDEKIIIDYNGNPVLSAYTPLAFEGLNWALLAEIDKAEAFTAISALKWVAMVVAAAGIAVIVAVHHQHQHGGFGGRSDDRRHHQRDRPESRKGQRRDRPGGAPDPRRRRSDVRAGTCRTGHRQGHRDHHRNIRADQFAGP